MASPTALPPWTPPPHRFEVAAGTILVGYSINLVLLGSILSQTTTYFTKSSRSEPYLKGVILFLVTVIAAKHLCDLIGTYQLLVQNYGNYAVLGTLSGFFKAGIFLAIVPGLFCQCWLLHRVYVVSQRNKKLLVALLLPVLGALALNVYYTSVRVAHPFESTTTGRLKILLPLWLSWTAATDLLLSGCFIYSVYRNAPEVLHPKLQVMLRQLVSVSVQACAPQTTCAVIALIVSRASPNTTVYLVFQVLLSPLYVTSLLYTLNAREDATPIKDDLDAETQIQSQMRSRGWIRDPPPSRIDVHGEPDYGGPVEIDLAHVKTH
ncbi:hypothetical protein T439DRAFT_321009 [Meredithblackwellia eburnea MCA 4105]